MSLYQLVTVHQDKPDWADDVERRVRNACTKVLRQDGPLVRLANVADAAKTGASSAVVMLATSAATSSEVVMAELEAVREEAIPVLPIACTDADLAEALPEQIRRLNALRWNGESEAEIAVLRFLGIIEADRQLFLSYRRAETNSLAIQLRHALSERAYDVFLDDLVH